MTQNGIDYGNTPEGFIPKRLADIISGIDSRLAAMGVVVDSQDGTLLSQIRGPIAEAISEVWDAASAAAKQFDPRYNSGAGQSGTVQLNGILRRPGTAAVLAVTFSGTADTIIPAGSLIATTDGLNRFSTDSTVTIGVGGTITGTATCTEKGISSVEEGEVISILTPVSGWTSVTNTSILVAGSAEETDAELRERQQYSTEFVTKSQVEAILDVVMNVPGVTYCRVYQNDEVSADTRGITAKAVAVVVLGGVDAIIAEALFNTVPLGVAYDGNTTVEVTDSQGFKYSIKFWRPTEIPIDINIQVTQTDVTMPTTYKDDIKNKIVEYAARGGSAVDSGEFDRDGFPPGQSVILSQLYTPINSVPGFSVVELEIAIHGGSPAPADVAIDWNEVATFDENNIAVVNTSELS